GLDNLVYVVDWNDFGIDNQSISSVVAGTPESWFASYGWRTFGAEHGEDWTAVTGAVLEAAHGENPEQRPSAVWSKTRKGRGYYVYDNASHGKPHDANSDLFWRCRRDFAEKYGVEWDSFGEPPADAHEMRRQLAANLNIALDVIRGHQPCLAYLADRLVELGDSVPEEMPGAKVRGPANPFNDPELYDYEKYPAGMWAQPGEKQPNRAALGRWGAYVNTWAKRKYGRPVFLACSADLADSTNISGFAKGFAGEPGYGVYERHTNPDGTLLPQEITEFTNAGLTCGIASVNLSATPFEEWDGFMAACSTYGSFVYLKYGPMRLFSQTVQDSGIKLGKVLWVAGHSGPETADDSRTHFGIFAPGVTQLFPRDAVVDLHPWEFNEVPVMIAAGLRSRAHIIALHLTRPPVTIPDRHALGIPGHFAAARGAYVLRPYREGVPKAGCCIVQGTASTANVVSLLPKLDELKLNVKIVAALSPQLFRWQPAEYRDLVIGPGDRFNSTVITNRSRKLAGDWMFNPLADEYAICSDWDDRWRTGGTLDEVIEEAHLSADWILEGIMRFAGDREQRLYRLRNLLEAAERD
ncbi:transketolase, partial [bacterium]|nr:transketolase [candidate division CSSED10-310 bacterium]